MPQPDAAATEKFGGPSRRSLAAPLIELAGIRKSYGDLLVNDGVDLTVDYGQVHALLGENGAGKTTLMRILYGLTRADGGQIKVDGKVVRITSPADAIAAGIGMVTQHFSLVGPMTVTENVMLSGVGLGKLDRAGASAAVTEAAARLGVNIDPGARIDALSVGEQQRVEIVKALSRQCRVLILDEPTAVLVPQDVDALFAAIRRLTADGLGVLFISHKLGEVSRISDQVSVLRRGQIAGSVRSAGIEPRALAEMMVGRPTVGVRRSDRPAASPTAPSGAEAAAMEVDLGTAKAVLIDQPEVPDSTRGAGSADGVAADAVTGEPVLRLRGIRLAGTAARTRDILSDIDLVVRSGEIVGMAGVSGNGQSELVELLCGLRRPSEGSIEVGGVDVTGASPRRVMSAGLGRITEDRHASVVPKMTVEQNLVLEDAAAFKRGPFLDSGAVRRHAAALIEQFSIKAAPTDPIGSLSGGNMQKVLLARALARDPVALVASQPTRGLDVRAAEFVHTQLLNRRAAGGGILLVSEDLEELLALSDRIVVIFAGRIVGELPIQRADPQALGLLMAGQAADAGEVA